MRVVPSCAAYTQMWFVAARPGMRPYVDKMTCETSGSSEDRVVRSSCSGRNCLVCVCLGVSALGGLAFVLYIGFLCLSCTCLQHLPCVLTCLGLIILACRPCLRLLALVHACLCLCLRLACLVALARLAPPRLPGQVPRTSHLPCGCGQARHLTAWLGHPGRWEKAHFRQGTCGQPPPVVCPTGCP